MSQPSKQDITAGQQIYHPWALKLYNIIVLWFSNNWVWRCSRQRQLQHYQKNISSNHLDVGIGTGYYLDHVNFPTNSLKLTLMDLNPNCLHYSLQLLRRYSPKIYKHDVFQPLDDINDQYDSIGVNYLLHCLPGTLDQKKIALENLSKKLSPNSTLFGSTILGDSAKHNFLGKYLISLYDRKKIFCNRQDSAKELKNVLQQIFREVHVEVIGAVALFTAKSPQTP